MDATAELTGKPTRDDYTSRPGALIWFFRKSRDRWKKKHQELKATVKGFKNQIAAVTKSREQWRLKAEQAAERVAELEAEVAALQAQAAIQDEKKKTEQQGGPLKLTQTAAIGAVWSAVSHGGRVLVRVAGAQLWGIAAVRRQGLGVVRHSRGPGWDRARSVYRPAVAAANRAGGVAPTQGDRNRLGMDG